MPQYDDLDIHIGLHQVRFRVEGADYSGVPDLGERTQQTLRQLHGNGSPSEYGQALLRAVFRDHAERGLFHLRQVLDAKDRPWFRVRLNLDLQDQVLHQFCWESLWDGGTQGVPPLRLGCAQTTPLSRYLPLVARRDSAKGQKLRVLVVIANPENLAEWQLDRLSEGDETRVFSTVLDELSDWVEYDILLPPASLGAIRKRLRDGHFHVLHLVGHGTYQEQASALLLERADNRKVDPVSDADLAQLVHDLHDLQLVVLAACHSANSQHPQAFLGLALRMVQANVPAVVAMQGAVSEPAARVFAESFYGALLRSEDTRGCVDVAVNTARDDLWFAFRRDNPWAWTVPVLFMRGSGLLFEPEVSAVGAAIPGQDKPRVTLDDVLNALTALAQQRQVQQAPTYPGGATIASALRALGPGVVQLTAAAPATSKQVQAGPTGRF